MKHAEINNKCNINCNFLDLQICQSMPSVLRDILYISCKQKSSATDILFTDDKMYSSQTILTYIIYDVLVVKKCRDAA